MNMRVDLNADLGEGAGHDDELLELVSSASIACGFHAGDPISILASIRSARERGVAAGAHPSFADRENFGRREVALPPGEVFAMITYQLGAFHALATVAGTRMSHVKAHGALYNMAMRDEKLAEAIAHAVLTVDSSLLFFAPGKSTLERAALSMNLRVVREVFADRNYLADGSLVPRTRPDALLHDPEEAARRVIRMLREGVVHSVDGKDVEVQAETICVHGDNPDAVAFVRALRSRLEEGGVIISAPGTSM
jgi:5-oxoprolinase (ATP-hydrolysing) subunit A